MSVAGGFWEKWGFKEPTTLTWKGVVLLCALNHCLTLELAEIRHRYIQIADFIVLLVCPDWLLGFEAVVSKSVVQTKTAPLVAKRTKRVTEGLGSYFFKTFLNNLTASHQAPIAKGWPFTELSALVTSLWKLALWKTDNSLTVLITVGKSMLETLSWNGISVVSLLLRAHNTISS